MQELQAILPMYHCSKCTVFIQIFYYQRIICLSAQENQDRSINGNGLGINYEIRVLSSPNYVDQVILQVRHQPLNLLAQHSQPVSSFWPQVRHSNSISFSGILRKLKYIKIMTAANIQGTYGVSSCSSTILKDLPVF